MFTHTHISSVSTPSGQKSPGAIQIQGAASVEIQEDFAPATPDQPLAFTLDVSQCKSLYINASVPLTIETNSSSSPGNSLILAANVPYIWKEGNYDTLKLTVDVTSLFITVPGAGAGVLTIAALYDPTI